MNILLVFIVKMKYVYQLMLIMIILLQNFPNKNEDIIKYITKTCRADDINNYDFVLFQIIFNIS